MSWFMFLPVLSCSSLCSFPCPSSLYLFPSGLSALLLLLLLWLIRNTCPAFASKQPLYTPSFNVSSVPEYPACSGISHVYSCYFRLPRDRFLFVFLVVSPLGFRSGYEMCLSQPHAWFFSGFYSSRLVCSASLSVLSFCCYFDGFLEH